MECIKLICFSSIPLWIGIVLTVIPSFFFGLVNEIAGEPFFALAKGFEEAGLLTRYETKLFERVDAFCAIFRYLIPIFGTRFYQPEHAAYQGKGVSTASFEDVKQFYLDTYEVVTEVATLVAAYNNLRHRGDHSAMASIRKDVASLSDFEAKTKANRLQYFSTGEDFDRFLSPLPDNKLRNTIGHNSYRFDGVRQLIIYNPDPKGDESKVRNKEFVEFLQDCWSLFLIVVDLSELVYQTRKVNRVTLGDSFVHPDVFKRAARRRVRQMNRKGQKRR